MVKMSRKVRAAACAAVCGVAYAQDGLVPATNPLPAVEEMETPGMCSVQGWEFVGRWNPPDNGMQIEGLEDCAAACAQDEFCSGTTHIEWLNDNPAPTCWFKQWGPGPTANPCEPSADMTADKNYHAIIKPPPGKTCGDLEFMADGPYTCESEDAAFEKGSDISDIPIGIIGTAAALAPAAAALAPAAVAVNVGATIDAEALKAAGYSVHSGFDFSPMQEPAPPPGTIMDLPPGTTEMDALACAARCTGSPDGCNAFSWYGDLPMVQWPGGQNCYIKVLAGCELPMEAMQTNNAAAFIILACEGADIEVEAANAAVAPAPAGMIVDPAVPPLTTDDTSDMLGSTPPTADPIAAAPVQPATDTMTGIVEEDDTAMAPVGTTPVTPTVGTRDTSTPAFGDGTTGTVNPSGAMPLSVTAAFAAAAIAAALL